MSVPVRILLLLGALWTFAYIFRSIHNKNKLKADETFFWFSTAGVLVILAVFPGIINGLAELLGVDSPANLVFLIFIFMLLIKVFMMDRKLAAIRKQTTEVIERLAIEELKEKNRENGNGAET